MTGGNSTFQFCQSASLHYGVKPVKRSLTKTIVRFLGFALFIIALLFTCITSPALTTVPGKGILVLSLCLMIVQLFYMINIYYVFL